MRSLKMPDLQRIHGTENVFKGKEEAELSRPVVPREATLAG